MDTIHTERLVFGFTAEEIRRKVKVPGERVRFQEALLETQRSQELLHWNSREPQQTPIAWQLFCAIKCRLTEGQRHLKLFCSLGLSLDNWYHTDGYFETVLSDASIRRVRFDLKGRCRERYHNANVIRICRLDLSGDLSEIAGIIADELMNPQWTRRTPHR